LLATNTCAASSFGQRLQQPSRPADPLGQGRAVELDAAAGIDQRLPVERQMIAILGDQHVGQQPWPRPTRSIGNDGIGIWCTLSHARQAKRGRT
jgi:hypothetical protein